MTTAASSVEQGRGAPAAFAVRAVSDQTFGAVVVDWDSASSVFDDSALVALRARVRDLTALGVHVAFLSSAPLGDVAGVLSLRPRSPGRVWLAAADGTELGRVGRGGGFETTALRSPQPPGATGGRFPQSPEARRGLDEVLHALDGYGVGPGLVLVVGDAEAAGHVARLTWGPGSEEPVTVDALLEVLDEQLERARELRVPDVDRDPAWCLVEEDIDELRLRAVESLFTVVSGGVGTRAIAEELDGPGSVLAEGCYSGVGPDIRYAPVPGWFRADVDPPPDARRWVLDLRTGLVLREEIPGSEGAVPLRSVRFASAHRPGLLAARVEAEAGRIDDDRLGDADTSGARVRTWETAADEIGEGPGCLTEIASRSCDGVGAVEHLAVVSPQGRKDADAALDRASAEGFDALLARHRRAWAKRWDLVDVRLPSDPELQRRFRFALYHLWGSGSGRKETALGARNLTGPAYHGHVFWDTDVFVLPALATVDPDAARSLVRYRLNRLAAAQEHARAGGWAGARFPWESAVTGEDVTPTKGYLGVEEIDIATGEQEVHVSADVAWAVVRAATLTRGPGRLSGKERTLIAETARYWASRVSVDDDGAVHLRGVMGPDEYHEDVDDNVFTNVLARWNLRYAASLPGMPRREADRWRRLAAALVDGYDEEQGRHEQFAGYFALDPVTVTEIGRPPLAADVLLGHDEVGRTQIIKQPDVLMAHVMLPEELVPRSLGPDCDYYVPRLAHGSSLSPAMTAFALARAGRPDEALDLLRLALRIDLDDLSGMTSGGVHLGALGGAWQALVFGFLGVDVAGDDLVLDPRLPTGWDDLEVRLRLLGTAVRIRVREGRVRVASKRAVRVRVGDRAPVWADPLGGDGDGEGER